MAGNNEERTYSGVWGEMKCLMLALNLRLLLSARCGAVRRQWEIGWGVQESWLVCLGVLNTGWEVRSKERMRLPNKSGREKVKDRPEKRKPRKLEGKRDKEKDRRRPHGDQGKGMLQGGGEGQQVKAAAQRVGFGNENFFSDLDGLAGQRGQR